jgi:hypothetical protein
MSPPSTLTSLTYTLHSFLIYLHHTTYKQYHHHHSHSYSQYVQGGHLKCNAIWIWITHERIRILRFSFDTKVWIKHLNGSFKICSSVFLGDFEEKYKENWANMHVFSKKASKLAKHTKKFVKLSAYLIEYCLTSVRWILMLFVLV